MTSKIFPLKLLDNDAFPMDGSSRRTCNTTSFRLQSGHSAIVNWHCLLWTIIAIGIVEARPYPKALFSLHHQQHNPLTVREGASLLQIMLKSTSAGRRPCDNQSPPPRPPPWPPPPWQSSHKRHAYVSVIDESLQDSSEKFSRCRDSLGLGHPNQSWSPSRDASSPFVLGTAENACQPLAPDTADRSSLESLILLQNTLFHSSFFQDPSPNMATRPPSKAKSSLLSATKASTARIRSSQRLKEKNEAALDTCPAEAVTSDSTSKVPKSPPIVAGAANATVSLSCAKNASVNTSFGNEVAVNAVAVASNFHASTDGALSTGADASEAANATTVGSGVDALLAKPLSRPMP